MGVTLPRYAPTLNVGPTRQWTGDVQQGSAVKGKAVLVCQFG